MLPAVARAAFCQTGEVEQTSSAPPEWKRNPARHRHNVQVQLPERCENWRMSLERYEAYCEENGLEVEDLTNFME